MAVIDPESKRVYFSFHNYIYRNSVKRNQTNDLKTGCQTAGLLWVLRLCKCHSYFHVYSTLVSCTSRIVSLKVKWYLTNCLIHQFGFDSEIKMLPVHTPSTTQLKLCPWCHQCNFIAFIFCL